MPLSIPNTKAIEVAEGGKPVFRIGSFVGTGVTITNSRLSSMQLIKEATGDGEHAALSTSDGYTWDQRPDIFASDLLRIFENQWRFQSDKMEAIIWQIYPNLDGVSISKLEYQVVGNSPGAAQRKDIHAHVRIAKKTTWESKVIPRIVDPLVPVPPK